MAIPTTIESLSTTAASNGPSGSDDRNTADDGLRQAYAFIKQTVSLGSNITSASTITPPSTGSVFNVTGTTAITTIASTNSWDGRIITFIFAGALTLTHSSNLALPGSANITTAANDIATFVQTASGAWRLVNYQTATDNLTVNGTLAVKGNTTLGDANTDSVTMNGNVAINAPNANKNLTLVGRSAANAVALYFNNASATSELLTEYALNSVTKAYTGVIGTAGQLIGGTVQYDYTIRLENANFLLSTNGGTSAALKIAAAGNHTIAAPSSGVALTVTGVAGERAISVGDGTASGYMPAFTIGHFMQIGTSSNHGLDVLTNAAPRLSISAAGNVTVAAPASGYGLNIPTGTPASAGASGTAGDIAWDSSYIYVCTATNTWKRAAISTW